MESAVPPRGNGDFTPRSSHSGKDLQDEGKISLEIETAARAAGHSLPDGGTLGSGLFVCGFREVEDTRRRPTESPGVGMVFSINDNEAPAVVVSAAVRFKACVGGSLHDVLQGEVLR